MAASQGRGPESGPAPALFESMPLVQYSKELAEWMLVVMERGRGLTQTDRERVLGYIDALLQRRTTLRASPRV